MKLFVIRAKELDPETDMADPKHPHLYWSNQWGWGTYEGATVYTDAARASQSHTSNDILRPTMIGECHWEEVSLSLVGLSDLIEDEETGTTHRERCIVHNLLPPASER